MLHERLPNSGLQACSSLSGDQLTCDVTGNDVMDDDDDDIGQGISTMADSTVDRDFWLNGEGIYRVQEQ